MFVRSILAMSAALLIAQTAVASDGRLSSHCIAILSDDAIDELDQDHSVCPDESGNVSFREGGTRDVNGIPNHELAELFADAEEYDRCRDLLAEEPFASAMRAIAGADAGRDPVPSAMRRVFEATQWEWRFFEPPRTDGFTVYACVDLEPLRNGTGPATVNLYKTMCGVSSIYSADVGRLNLGTRFISVAAHEIGHVIDELSGCSESFSPDAETRATIYGSFIAGCHARRWRSYYALLAEEQPSAEYADRERLRQQALGCLGEKWSVMEQQLAALRHDLVRKGRTGSSPLFAISACAFAANSNAAAPRLDRCPTEGRK